MINFVQCPVCKSNSIQYSFTAKDYTVSNKKFDVWKCDHCNALFTQGVPSEDEIQVYYASNDYISHSEIQEGFVNRLYHFVRNITLAEKKILIEKETGITKGMILDVGAGTGSFLNNMRNGGWQVAGVEPDQGAREKAASLYNLQIKACGELFSLPTGHFDAITLWHVLEHVHQLHKYVQQLTALLKEKGKLFIALPNHTSADAIKYKEYWAGFDVPRHLYHFSPQSVNTLMNMHGLEIKTIKPMWFDSFYVSLLSEKYKKGNLLSAFISGLSSNVQALFNKEKCSSVIYIVGKN